jgi:hypothetical protein
MKRRWQKIAPAGLAGFTVVALFLLPLCGTLCDAPRHCPAQATVALSNSDDCHRFALAEASDDSRAALTTTKTCAPPEIFAVILDATKSWSTLHSDRISAMAISAMVAVQSHVFSLAVNRRLFLYASGMSPSTDPLSHSAILQI